MANQRKIAVKQLDDKIVTLEQQLRHVELLKEKAEMERETAKSAGAETKVCIQMHVLFTVYTDVTDWLILISSTSENW